MWVSNVLRSFATGMNNTIVERRGVDSCTHMNWNVLHGNTSEVLVYFWTNVHSSLLMTRPMSRRFRLSMPMEWLLSSTIPIAGSPVSALLMLTNWLPVWHGLNANLGIDATVRLARAAALFGCAFMDHHRQLLVLEVALPTQAEAWIAAPTPVLPQLSQLPLPRPLERTPGPTDWDEWSVSSDPPVLVPSQQASQQPAGSAFLRGGPPGR